MQNRPERILLSELCGHRKGAKRHAVGVSLRCTQRGKLRHEDTEPQM